MKLPLRTPSTRGFLSLYASASSLPISATRLAMVLSSNKTVVSGWSVSCVLDVDAVWVAQSRRCSGWQEWLGAPITLLPRSHKWEPAARQCKRPRPQALGRLLRIISLTERRILLGRLIKPNFLCCSAHAGLLVKKRIALQDLEGPGHLHCAHREMPQSPGALSDHCC